MAGPTTSMPAAIRRERMLTVIKDQEFARVGDLSDRFGISEVTVRTDLDHLERRGKVLRVHGGAIPHTPGSRVEPTFEQAVGASAAEKSAIGTFAASLVAPGETVLVDVGTTNAALAEALIERTDLEGVVILTNGLNIALQFERAMPRFTVVVTGGTLRARQHSLVEPYAALLLDQLYADVFFLGCNGIHPEAGVSNINMPEAQMKRRMMRAARRTVVLADGGKVGQISTARVAPIEDVDLLVTGPSAPEVALRELIEVGLSVHVAAPASGAGSITKE